MRSSRAIAAAAVLTATAAVAIATTSAGSQTTTSTTPVPGRPSVQLGEKAAREALALWNRFPVNVHPRPIVIPFGPGIVYPPRDQHEDLAIYGARWNFTAPRATDVVTARRRHWITVTAAVKALRSGLKHAPKLTNLLTVRARLGQASFVTDRGRVRLPAWQFYFGHFRDPASVLAVTPFNSPPPRRLDPNGIGNSEDGEQAVISADDRTLRIFFVGGPAGNRPCDDSYSARVRTSRHAVAFTITEFAAPTPPHLICTAIGYTRSVVVRLTRPLGARVLVNSTDGGAIPAARKPTFG
jgi:hypothetical protein